MNIKFTKLNNMLTNRAIFEDYPCIKYLIDDKLVVISNKEFFNNCLIYKKIVKEMGISSLAILLPKSPELIYYFLGSILAGSRTCLIDNTEPIEKIEQMLRTFQPQYIAKNNDDFSADENLSIENTLVNKTNINSASEGDAVFFTSGTSGPAKGVLLSASSLLASAYNGQEMLPCHDGDVVLSLLPFSHIYGFICTFLWPLCYGGIICLGRGMRSLLTDPKIFSPTILPIIPSLATFLLLHDALDENIKTILIGAGPLSENIIRLIKKKNIILSFGYGLTETSSGVAISVNNSDPLAMAKCPGNEFKIEEDGRILIKSNTVMLGYFNDAKSTSQVMKDGYFITNDIGFIDKNGCLHISGRTDDIIILENGTKFNCAKAEEDFQKQMPYLDFAFAESNGKIKFVYYSKDVSKLEMDKYINAFNSSQPIYSKISIIEKLEHPLYRTKTNKIQRYKL